MGRVKTTHQVTDGQTYGSSLNPSYGYNLQGQLTSETYPSGRTITMGYDTAGRTNTVAGALGGVNTNYVQTIAYAPPGGMTSMALGNTLTETRSYNNRLQPTSICLGNWGGFNYDFGGGSNNGNVVSQTMTALNQTQTYSYDNVNRLTQVSESSGWNQTYGYDRYGNRTSIGESSQYLPTYAPISGTINIGANTNRITDAGFSYDATGNVTQAPVAAGGATQSFAYDAENKLVNFNSSAATYSYDGDGRRVKKVNGSSSTIFVYDTTGKLVAEYSNTAATGSGTKYITADHLGSTRLVTDATGAVLARHDYLPFGEEIPALFGNRSSVTGYNNSDDTKQKFTAKERDAESGLDFFGARYMSSAQGLFTSPDPSRLSAFIDSPQSWNMYTYAYNNPFRFVDKNGRWPTTIHNQIIDAAFPNLSSVQRQILKDVSAHQDAFLTGGTILGGQANDLSYEHAMRGPGQSVADAQSDYQYFVSLYENSATKAQINFWVAGNPGLSKDALAMFGVALHAILDSTSPAHAGFQVWDLWNPALVWRHDRAESSISPQQLNTAVTAAKKAFNATFNSNFNEFDLLQLLFQAEQEQKKSQPKPYVTVRICYETVGGLVCQ
jgi:RHS repeat-associated protein